MRKKLILGIIILFFCASAVSVLAATTNIFSDVPIGSWFESAVNSMKEKQIMNGYDDSTFRPNNKVNRAELAVTLDSLLRYLRHPQGNTAWRKFINKDFSFTIAYPPTWTSKRFFPYLSGFQPPNMTGNNVQWAVIVVDDIGDALENEIGKMASEYSKTRTIMREKITINDVEALRVTARTTSKPDWIHTQIFVQMYGKIFIITNGAIPDSDFELFYSSFKIMPPEEQKTNAPATEPPASFEPSLPIAIGKTQFQL